MPVLYDTSAISTVLDKLSDGVTTAAFRKDVALILDMDISWSEKTRLIGAYLDAVTGDASASSAELGETILVGAGVSSSDVIPGAIATGASSIGWAMSAPSKASAIDRIVELATQRVWSGYRSTVDGTLLQRPKPGALATVLSREDDGLDTVDELLDSIFPTVKKSGVRWARVPSASACDFCMMLATRGAVYLSRESAAGKGGYHSSCRCLPVPSTEYRPTAAVKNFDWRSAMKK